MNKTNRRSAIVVVITGLLLLAVLALSTGIASEDSATLNDWNGTWLNLGTMLDDPAMNVVYEAMTDAANAAAGDSTFTTNDAKSFLYAMHKSNFGDLGIAGNNISYYNTDGTVKCDCEYESAGVETVAFGEEEFNWYKFALTSEDTTCPEYRYLIFTEVHSHEGGMVHWHMRYGNTSFDDLITNTNYAIWYPTFAVEGTTMETVADGYAEGAEMMGGMMLASQGSIVPAERIYGLARHLEAAVDAVHDDGVHVLEGAKGEFEMYKVEIQQGIDAIRGFAAGVEQRRAELYDLTKDLEGEHVEAIYKETGKFKTFADEIIAYAQQLDALKDDPIANEEEILEIAGKLHSLMHSASGPPKRIIRHAEALGYEVPVSGKEIVMEYTDVVYPVVVQRLSDGNTLIVDCGEGSKKVIEVNPDMAIVWEYPVRTYSARRLPNGNTLMGDFAPVHGDPCSVTEITPDKEIVWQYTGDFIPSGADRLANGNTVVADPKHHRLFEVTPEKEVVWEYTDLIYVWSVQCLPNGNMLTIESKDPEKTDTRVVEITRDKEIIWEFSEFVAPFGWVQRLPNGNTVITDSKGYGDSYSRIIEVAPDGEIVWEYTDIDLTYPCGVHRLENGNTMIADCQYPRVIEVGAP